MKLKKIFPLLLSMIAAILFGSVFSATSSSTELKADSSAPYVQKVVSVVFDNSGSMSGDKEGYATYSIKLLASLLDSKDLLYIVPMNKRYGVDNIQIDLTNLDRENEINSKITSTHFSASGGTPEDSVNRAMNILVNNGLKKSSESSSLDNKEYWLVVLTDGAFDYHSSVSSVDTLMCTTIAGYSGLHSIYYSFGSGGVDLRNSIFEKNYSGNALFGANNADIVAGMKRVSSLLGGRYEVDSSALSVSSSTLTIDLDSFDFAISNISVITQNTSSKLLSASYPGNSVTIEHGCSISQRINSRTTLSCYSSNLTIVGDYFSKGQVVLTFDSSVSGADFSILVEPALKLETYIEVLKAGTWEKMTPIEVNAKCVPGDVMRIGYIVTEEKDGNIIDVEATFGTPTTKATYNGKSYDIASSKIPLVAGSNELVVTISIFEGRYTLIDSDVLVVEADPTNYRVEGNFKGDYGGDHTKGLFEFTGYANGKKLLPSDYSGASGYNYSIDIKDPNGDPVTGQVTLKNDGVISVLVSNASTGLLGVYTVKCVITSSRGLTREVNVSGTFLPPITPTDFDVKGNSVSIYQGNENLGYFCFNGYGNGGVFDKSSYEGENPYLYSIVVNDSNGFPVTPESETLQSNGNIEVVVSNATTLLYGTYNAVCTITSPRGDTKSLTLTVEFYPPTPSDFDVAGAVTEAYQNDKEQVLFSFYGYGDGKKLDKSRYEGVGAYVYDVIVNDPNGNKITSYTETQDNDGTINILVNASASQNYGKYSATVKITSVTNVSKEKTITGSVYPPVAPDFAVNGSVVKPYQNLETQALFSFTGFAYGKQIVKSDYSGDLAYTYSIVAYNPMHDEITPESIVMDNSGEISVVISCQNSKVYGEYSVTCEISTTDGTTVSKKLTTSFYPVASLVDINSIGEQEIVLTGSQLATNNKKFEFEVINDGDPLYIDSSSFACHLSIGGVDVTSYATIKDNKVSFVPNDRNLPDILKVEDGVAKEITLEIVPVSDESIKYVCQIRNTLTLNKTVYKVNNVPSTNKNFDRYDVGSSEAVVYFSFGYDDVVLSEQQIADAIENGDITFDLHPLGWLTGLPANAETGATTIDGVGCAYVKINCDIDGFFGNLLGSLIFKDERTVRANYHGTVSEDTFTITPVSAGSHLWRMAVLLGILLLIVHILTYLIGFIPAVAKPLPKGIFVICSLDTSSANSIYETNFNYYEYNTGVWEKIKWHLKRFIPFFEFANQKMDGPYGGVDIYWEKGKTNATIKYNQPEVRAIAYDNAYGTTAQLLFDEYFNELKAKARHFNSVGDVISREIYDRDMKRFFYEIGFGDSSVNEDKEVVTDINSSVQFFGEYENIGDRSPRYILKNVMFFIKH